FVFQAEDGIRDDLVTGVQTCALPISATGQGPDRGTARALSRLTGAILPLKRSFPPIVDQRSRVLVLGTLPGEESLRRGEYYAHQIGRAACRGRRQRWWARL